MRVVIIGGVATGPKTAARLKRLRPDANITIIEQGDMISYGACGLPLYLGNLIPDMAELMMTSSGSVRDVEFFYNTKDIKVLTHTRAEGINREQKTVYIRSLLNGKSDTLPYDYLVLATGANPIIPQFPGKDLSHVFTLHHPHDAIKLRELVRSKKVQHLTIIGAGLIGMEAADALFGPRLKVTICEAQSHILPNLLDADMAVLLEQVISKKGVEVLLSCKVQALTGAENGAVAKVETSNGTIETDAVLLAIGMRPNVELARAAGLELGVTGAIHVNSHLQTNDPYIYAGGDCVENMDIVTGEFVYAPLASTANKHGRVIADNIAGRSVTFPGVSKTSVLQCFDQNIGRTGLGEVEAIQKGLDVSAITISGFDATHYFPMHDKLNVKIIAEKESTRVLGMQIIGSGEAIKRLDVVATAIKFDATLKDISNVDLGYAPPFSTAIDLIAHAANALQNKIDKIVQSLSAKEFSALTLNNEGSIVIDIRNPDEVQSKPLQVENRIEIPLAELHHRWIELPTRAKLITVCELGIRSYEAACILQGKGFSDVAYLEGGLTVLNT